MRPERLGRRVFFILAGLFLVFIAYVSWMPPTWDRYAPTRGFFSGITRLPVMNWHSFRDLITNVLLYMPLGGFVAAALASSRARAFSWWLGLGFVVTCMMELGQAVFDRVPDAMDIVANTVGYMLGYCLVLFGVRRLGLNPFVIVGFDAEHQQVTRSQSIAVARFVYVCVYLFIALVPFDLSVTFTEIYAQLLPNELGYVHVVVDPFYHLGRWGENGGKLLVEWAAFLPIAFLSVVLNARRGRTHWVLAVFPCVTVALASELAQLFILSRTSDVIMMPIALSAGFAGWGLGLAWLRGYDPETGEAGMGERMGWRGPAILLLVTVVGAMLWSGAPFEFESDGRAAARKILSSSNWIPFAVGLDGRTAVRIILFAPIGALTLAVVKAVPRMRTHGHFALYVCALAASVALGSELLGVAGPDRYVDVTNVIMAVAAALGGAVLFRRFRPRRAGADER